MDPITFGAIVLIAMSLMGVIEIPWWQIVIIYTALLSMAMMAAGDQDED